MYAFPVCYVHATCSDNLHFIVLIMRSSYSGLWISSSTYT